jgi:hypothetical protein
MSFDLKLQNGDLSLDNGSLKTIIDTEKLVQDILKICLTEAGSNPSAPWYGSLVSRSMIGSVLDTGIVVEVGKSQLSNALDNLKQLQDQQSKSFQSVSPDELINNINVIDISRSAEDPRLFIVSVKVISKGLKQVQASFKLSTI